MCHRSTRGGVNKVKEPIRGAGLRTEKRPVLSQDMSHCWVWVYLEHAAVKLLVWSQ